MKRKSIDAPRQN